VTWSDAAPTLFVLGATIIICIAVIAWVLTP